MSLVIRDAQFAVFDRKRDAIFEAVMISHLRANYGIHVAGWSDDEFRDLFAFARNRAARLTDGDDGYRSAELARLVEYLVLYGRGFGTSRLTAWASRILDDTGRSLGARLDEIDTREAALIAG